MRQAVRTSIRALLIGLIAVAGTLPLRPPSGPEASSPLALPAHAAVEAAYGKLPLSFEPNAGQTDPEVQFLARGPGYVLFLTADEMVLRLRQTAPPLSKGRVTGLEARTEVPSAAAPDNNQ